jgi:hypothetical protein
LFHHSVTLPDTLGGQPQITTGPAASTVSDMEQKMADQDHITGGDGAAYGVGTAPTYFVLAAPGDPETPQQLFDSQTADATSAGLTIGAPSQQVLSGVTFICADIQQGATTSGAVCVWSDGTQGLVISTGNGVDQTVSAAAEAKAAI